MALVRSDSCIAGRQGATGKPLATAGTSTKGYTSVAAAGSFNAWICRGAGAVMDASASATMASRW